VRPGQAGRGGEHGEERGTAWPGQAVRGEERGRAGRGQARLGRARNMARENHMAQHRCRLTVAAVLHGLPQLERKRLTPADLAARHRWSVEGTRRVLALACQAGLVGQRRNGAGKLAYWRLQRGGAE